MEKINRDTISQKNWKIYIKYTSQSYHKIKQCRNFISWTTQLNVFLTISYTRNFKKEKITDD